MTDHRPRGALFVFLLALFLCTYGHVHAAPRVRAVRTVKPPTVDGVLDEPEWQRAARIDRFVQRIPSEGKQPDQRTELRILYDESALYVGLRMWDDQPQRIRRAFGRRDSIPDSDWVTLFVDPLRNRDRGYFFQLNASGVMADGLVYQEVVLDGSWDAVWSGAVRVDGHGWTAELAIPLTSIVFQDQPEQSWGIYVERHVQRIKQTSCWPPMPKDSNTFVSRFAELQGLVGLKRGRALRVVPYAAGELVLGRHADALRPDRRFRPNGGLDLQWGHGGELMVHAALNPDFGEVEDDPAVVNLGWGEVFFGERRPFFMAGADLFRTPITLLHTRRIGARPAAPDPTSEEGTIVELDPEARILGALKGVGEIGLASWGVLGALVLPTHATERLADGTTVERDATPGLQYSTGRLRFRLGRSSGSSVGLMATGMTHLDREAGTDAYAGGLDWDLRSSSGWQATGQLTGANADAGAGYGLWASAGQKGDRDWRYWVEAESFSQDYEINDVGYQWRNDMVRLRGYFGRRLAEPWRALREWHAFLWGQHAFSHSAPEIAFDRRVELYSWAKLTSLWEAWAGIGHRLFTLDDRESRGGPVYPRPWEVYGWVGGMTNTAWWLVLENNLLVSREAAALTLTLEGNLRAALWDRLTLTLWWRWRRARGYPRWVETVERAGDRDRFIFGDLDQDELELKLSALLGLHRSLTFQVFGQVLHSVGSYERYRELVLLADGQTTLAPTAYDAEADFSTLHLIVNAVLRWDLGAGTAAYLVYKMQGALDRDGRPVAFDMAGAWGELWGREQTHLLLLKLAYGWSL